MRPPLDANVCHFLGKGRGASRRFAGYQPVPTTPPGAGARWRVGVTGGGARTFVSSVYTSPGRQEAMRRPETIRRAERAQPRPGTVRQTAGVGYTGHSGGNVNGSGGSRANQKRDLLSIVMETG